MIAPVSPDEYIDSLDEARQADVRTIDDLIQRVAPQLDRQFERGMIIYGGYRYHYQSGSEGYWYPVALSGQKRFTALYVMGEDERGYVVERYRDRLTDSEVARNCVRFATLDGVDLKVVEALVEEGATFKPR